MRAAAFAEQPLSQIPREYNWLTKCKQCDQDPVSREALSTSINRGLLKVWLLTSFPNCVLHFWLPLPSIWNSQGLKCTHELEFPHCPLYTRRPSLISHLFTMSTSGSAGYKNLVPPGNWCLLCSCYPLSSAALVPYSPAKGQSSLTSPDPHSSPPLILQAPLWLDPRLSLSHPSWLFFNLFYRSRQFSVLVLC